MNKLTTAALSAVIGLGVTVSATPSAHAAASIQARALSAAVAKEGKPYRYGAAGPSAFDCSGLVQYVYKSAGKKLPRTAQAQYNAAGKISWKSRIKGDLIAIGTSPSRITHVGIYAGYWSGKAWMWNANTGSYRGKKIVLAPIDEYLGGGRHTYYGRIK